MNSPSLVHPVPDNASVWSDEIRALAAKAECSRILSTDAGEAVAPDVMLVCTETLGHAKLSDTAILLDRLAMFPARAALAVTIDLEPQDWGKQNTLLPMLTWRRLLEMAGFEIVHEVAVPERPVAGPGFLDHWLKTYWRDADLFGESAAAGKSRAVLLRRKRGKPKANLIAEIGRLLDMEHVRSRQDLIGDRLHRPLILNIHQMQDYLCLRPLLDLLDPSQVTPLIREHAEFRPVRRFAVATDLRRRGFSPQFYQHLDQIDWNALAGRPLLSASESSISEGHSLSRQVVEAATIAGCPTVLFQHGVWSESFADHPVSFGSQQILTWGSEHARSFARELTNVFGLKVPRGATPMNRFLSLGAPKYAETLEHGGGVDSLCARFGVNRSEFAGVTLVGTNLHWPRHTEAAGFAASFADLTRSKRDELFILKVHPAESFYAYETLRDRNVLIYDDVLALAIDYPISRLIRGVDRVISSLSSLLVDAGVAGKPVFQYATGNSLSYDGVEPVPLSQLSEVFTPAGMIRGQASAAALSKCYAEANHARVYEELAIVLDELIVTDERRQEALAEIGAYSLIERMTFDRQIHELRVCDVEDLSASGLFDPDFYALGKDMEGLSPIEHFLTRGGWQGHDPRAAFNSEWYGRQNPQGRRGNVLPVLHYIRQGASLGYDPHPLFRDSWYRARSGPIAADTTPLAHYITDGEHAGVSCHPFFDAAYYRTTLSTPVECSLLEHFIAYQGDVGGDPSRSFSIAEYIKLAPDLNSSGINPLVHYVTSGASERRHRSELQGR